MEGLEWAWGRVMGEGERKGGPKKGSLGRRDRKGGGDCSRGGRELAGVRSWGQVRVPAVGSFPLPHLPSASQQAGEDGAWGLCPGGDWPGSLPGPFRQHAPGRAGPKCGSDQNRRTQGGPGTGRPHRAHHGSTPRGLCLASSRTRNAATTGTMSPPSPDHPRGSPSVWSRSRRQLQGAPLHPDSPGNPPSKSGTRSLSSAWKCLAHSPTPDSSLQVKCRTEGSVLGGSRHRGASGSY